MGTVSQKKIDYFRQTQLPNAEGDRPKDGVEPNLNARVLEAPEVGIFEDPSPIVLENTKLDMVPCVPLELKFGRLKCQMSCLCYLMLIQK